MSIHNENYSANSTELPRVAVLMSTYSGEIFIREQIEVFWHRKVWQLVFMSVMTVPPIRHSKSLKNTRMPEISRFYPAKKNVGPGRSFMTLIFAVSKRTDFDTWRLPIRMTSGFPENYMQLWIS